jgi:hypothetical protein
MSVCGRLDGCGSIRCPAAPRNRGRGVRTAPSNADTAAVCGCPPLQEAVTGPASAGGVQPPPVRLADLAGQPLAELLAHVGHGWLLQR